MPSKMKNVVTMYDDLIHNTNVLTRGIEDSFLTFVNNQEQCRKQWRGIEKEVENLQHVIKNLEYQKSTLETNLVHARDEFNQERKRRMRAENNRDALENQIQLIRELLMSDKNSCSRLNEEQWAFLSQPSQLETSPKRLFPIDEIEKQASFLSDISYDKTDDDLEVSYLRSGRQWKRPTAPSENIDHQSPPKRPRYSGSNIELPDVGAINTSITAKTTISIPHNGGPMTAISEISTDKPRRDEGNFNNCNRSEAQQNTPQPTTPGIHSQMSASRLTRNHTFVDKKVYSLETCTVCGRRIRLGSKAHKCRECKTITHGDCLHKAPLPCIPATPGASRGDILTIADFVTKDSPMVPAIVIMCVNEIEARGFSQGLYRENGDVRVIKQLREQFMSGRASPNLANVNDINVVCGCMKTFFTTLKETLVTFRMWKDFVRAADCDEQNERWRQVCHTIDLLPQANRDTIAFLILHLKRVADSDVCRMDLAGIAKVFGPTIVGNSKPKLTPLEMINETRSQASVMEMFLSMPYEYWDKFMISVDDDDYDDEPLMRTPATPTVLTSMLGPATTPGSRHDVAMSAQRTQQGSGPRSFFSSPSLR